MQDRYVGDVGDFAKYSLLNSLSSGRLLGVAWYLFPDEGHNDDGKHVSYLTRPSQWRGRDPEVFDGLKKILEVNGRKVTAVENSGLLKAGVYSGELLQCHAGSYQARSAWRKTWFARLQDSLRSCDLVFADPDNGLISEEKFRFGRKKHWKSIPVQEAKTLAKDRTAVIYHHNTRRAGGHEQEIQYWLREVEAPIAVRVRYGSSRTFFVLNPSPHDVGRIEDWASQFDCGKDKVQIFRKQA